jgi:hypothetical protein
MLTMMKSTTSSAVPSMIVKKENTMTINDPTSSKSRSRSRSNININSNSIVRGKKQTNKKQKLTVRFDLVPAVGDRLSNEKKSTTTTDACRYKRIYDDDDDDDDDYKSTLWWSPKELKHIELSVVLALEMKELGLFPPNIADTDVLSIQRYTKQSRIQRKKIRKQKYLTIQKIKEFEIITKRKIPPELLSVLLQRITT